jgi:hypothetical protein
MLWKLKYKYLDKINCELFTWVIRGAYITHESKDIVFDRSSDPYLFELST